MANLGMSQLTSAKIGLSVALCLSLFLIADSQLTDPKEVNALRSIKNSLVDHGKLDGWKRGDPCTSNWSGINCYDTPLEDGYFHVKELFLLNLNLSGSLAPELGLLSNLTILDFMWNNLTGFIPKEIGNISTLQLLLLNGNQLTGSLPHELGNLSNLDRIQIDQNQISGEIPLSFANLSKARHFHMNNNLLSGQIPPDLYRLPILIHLLLDNNNLSGYLPPQLSETPRLKIIQLDNNNFEGSTIPATYGNMSRLLKLSLRNCSLQGPIPDWSNLPDIAYIDLSWNQLNGSIPPGALSENITTIDLSNNKLNGTIPASFSRLPLLQKLSLANNSLSGSVPSTIWQNRILNETERLLLDFAFNEFSNISGNLFVPQNVSIGLQGNPACSSSNLSQFCVGRYVDFSNTSGFGSVKICDPQSCPPPYEYAPVSLTNSCFCAAPLYVGYRLKSPGFSDFLPYAKAFEVYLSSGLGLDIYQLDIDSLAWQKGPRLRMYLKIFPLYINNSARLFNRTEILRIRGLFGGWMIPDNEVFGPFELLNFTLSDLYPDDFPRSSSGISKGALVGIIFGTIAGTITLTALVALLLVRRYLKRMHTSSKRRLLARISKKIDGVKDFTYAEMALATNNFNSSSQVGEGGYGKVYRGVLADETVVAIKRAQEGSLQGEKEFLTEIDLLSRLHHRNLVSLVGYCDEEGEQMLVYEFMSSGTLRDHLSGKSKVPLNFATRVRIALASARGILYLHAEANPPIFHRDIKSSNILLDSKLIAKVADFGLSRLAPLPELEGAMPEHVSTVVKGTPGYLDPEYFLTQKLTDKSDVYSLGVVFFELLTGMHPIFHGKNIVREVNVAYSSGVIFSVIDERMGSYPSECVEKFVNLALNCCRDDPDARPSMAKVVRELENIWYMMPESDTKITESIVTDPGKFETPASSASSSKVPFFSQDVSGNELVSGVFPTVIPR
ncbi:probable LRR receptor-like serine/threonine-protein kinase At1g06840 [Primulina huaijiensis]|uniref:probable LRR receptor-like serine/threonine-protein kinase At1g06840 n=1 Tax=Primulina huaijiensis TaxID=1492673 RepID=UPI003CC6E0D5